MTRIITFANNKGGTGKTTTCLNIGVGLANQKKKVLLIDLDGQANLTSSLGITEDQTLDNSVSELLLGKVNINNCIRPLDKLDIIPSNTELNDIEPIINNKVAREKILKNRLKDLQKEYDYILIDTPPALNVIVYNSLVASTEVFIVMQPEVLALNGVAELTRAINDITAEDELNPNLFISGVIINDYDRRKNINKVVYDNLKAIFKDKVFNTIIGTSTAIIETSAYHTDIYNYAPNSNASEDYTNLVNEIIKQEKEIGKNE
jgi:chromosome partitioning protein